MRAVDRSAIRLLAVTLSFALFTLPAVAQMSSHDPALHGIPPSVTSFGFGGHPGFHGVPPSVTSLNFGRVPVRRPPIAVHRRHRREFANPFLGGVYYVPYAVPYDDYSDYSVMSPGGDDTMEDEYSRPGPTIFDSHGAEGRGYPAPRAPENYRSPQPPTPGPTEAAQPQEPPQEQPATLLVFKDGRKMEVGNYAIVGTTLYDLSDGRSKKVALAELDLSATVKQNDDRGVEFKLPASAKL